MTYDHFQFGMKICINAIDANFLLTIMVQSVI